MYSVQAGRTWRTVDVLARPTPAANRPFVDVTRPRPIAGRYLPIQRRDGASRFCWRQQFSTLGCWSSRRPHPAGRHHRQYRQQGHVFVVVVGFFQSVAGWTEQRSADDRRQRRSRRTHHQFHLIIIIIKLRPWGGGLPKGLASYIRLVPI